MLSSCISLNHAAVFGPELQLHNIEIQKRGFMSEIDFQVMLDKMSSGGIGSDPIKSIYDILPTFDPVQQLLLFQAFYFIEKYNLEDMRAMFEKFTKVMASNKNLGLMSSQNLKSLLSAYTQNELVRGIKVQAVNDVSNVQT